MQPIEASGKFGRVHRLDALRIGECFGSLVLLNVPDDVGPVLRRMSNSKLLLGFLKLLNDVVPKERATCVDRRKDALRSLELRGKLDRY